MGIFKTCEPLAQLCHNFKKNCMIEVHKCTNALLQNYWKKYGVCHTIYLYVY